MKVLFKFFIALLFCLQLPAYSVTFNVLTLPADLYNGHENYFGFAEPSELFSNDIIINLNSTHGKIISPDLYVVREKLNKNEALQKELQKALRKFHHTKYIDYQTYKKAGNLFGANSILLVRSYVTSEDNDLKRSVWDILDIASYFSVSHNFYLNTNIVLLDTVNNIPMWQNTYVKKISNNEGYFIANNYAQARTQYEKLKLYSKNIISADATQNIMLRFFPKVISPVDTQKLKNSGTDGGILRYDKNIPSPAKSQDESNTSPTDYGEMLFDF